MRLPVFSSFIFLFLLSAFSFSANAKMNAAYYRLETWYFSTPQQETLIDDYLEKAYLPALHGYGLKHIGVFKPIANDTASVKSVYILIAFSSWKQVQEIDEKLSTNQGHKASGAAFLNAPFDAPAYNRKEITLLKAFSMAPNLALPALTAPLTERVYELRSYESATDSLYRNKVHMFNEGGEVALFKRLGFNAVFYGDVVAGAKMPNLMYLTCFNSMDDRNAHWKTFSNDPEWKSLSGNPFYRKNVSKADIILTRPAPYSDY